MSKTKQPKRYFWLKLKDDFFQQKEIKQLRRIAGGDTYTIIYLKILLLSLKNDGKVFFDGVASNFADEVALEIDESEENTEVTLNFLQQKGLLEFNSDDEAFLSNIASMIGSESESARRVRNHRTKKALQSNDGVTAMKRLGNTEIELEKEIELEIDKDAVSAIAESAPPEKWLSLEIWEQNNGFPNMVVMEDMKILTKEIGDELLAYAIRETAIREIRGKGTWKYVESIVNNWKKLSLDTVEKVKQYQERWEMDQQNQRSKKFGNQSPRKETMPEWAEKEVKETPISAEEQAEWDKRLKKISK